MKMKIFKKIPDYLEKLKLIGKQPLQVRTVVEISAGVFKVVQIEVDALRASVCRVFEFSVSDMENSQQLKELKQKLTQDKIIAGPASLVLSRHAVTTRYLKLPSEDEDDLAQMLKFQIPKLLPYNPGEIISSFKVIGLDKAGNSICLVVLCQHALVRQQYSFLEKLGMNVEDVFLSSEASVSWLSKACPETAKKLGSLLIDIDRENADIILVKNSRIMFTRSMFSQREQTQAPEIWREKLGAEIQRSLKNATQETGISGVDKIILTGAIENQEGAKLKSYLQESTGIVVEEIGVFSLNLGKCKPQSAVKSSFCSLLGALSAAGDSLTINLIPPEEKDKLAGRRFSRIREKCLKLSAVFFIIIMLFGLKQVLNKKELLSAYQAKINSLLPMTAEQEELSVKIEKLNKELSKRIFVTKVLSRLYSNVPESVFLTSVSVEVPAQMTIKGFTVSPSQVFALVEALEKSNDFSYVKVGFLSKRKVRQEEFTDFQVNCGLKD